MGFDAGDVVAIFADPVKEWVYFDLACQSIGGVATGIYATDSAEQLAYICNSSKTRYLVVENEEQLDKWLEVRADVPCVEKVIILDDKGLKDFRDSSVITIDHFANMGMAEMGHCEQQWNQRIDNTHPDDTAILVYTSGTTGKPKAAEITHHNAIWMANCISGTFQLKDDTRTVSYLPLCHVVERALTVWQSIKLGSTVHFIEASDTAFENITEVSPNFLMGVPRIWEKMYSVVTIKIKEATWFGRLAYNWAFKVGYKSVAMQDQGKRLSIGQRLSLWLADKTVFHNTRVMLGLDQARVCVSGAAPISADLLNWFRAMNINMFEGYGQTECSGMATANTHGATKMGSIGRPSPGVEMKLADDGEILIKGPLVFKGYLNEADKTSETVVDGWLQTGDVGRVDDDGFYYITDRKKNIIITAGGKNITPSEIENEMKASPYISDAVVIGDGRKYLTSLVMIDYDTVSQYAQDLNVPFTDFQSLCQAEEVQALMTAEIDQANSKFARVETVKAFRLIEKQLTAEDEELTATMKLKRSYVEQAYAELIDTMYRG